MRSYIIAIGIWTMSTSAALADQVDLTNNIDIPVFKVYAWPTDLVARTFNILGSPLFPKSTEQVDVDNTYGDCNFTFEYDPNDPNDMKRPGYKKKLLVTFETNLCVAKGKINIDPLTP